MNFGFLSASYLWILPLLVLLLAIYLFQRKKHRKVISTFFLYDLERAPSTQGRKLNLRRPPWTFFVEFLIILLMILALAEPFLLRKDMMPPVAIILDDSLSMLAAMPGGESPRAKAEKLVLAALKNFPNQEKLLIFAGEHPQQLSVSGEISPDLLKNWRNSTPEANLVEALKLLTTINFRGEIMIVSDHLPKDFQIPVNASFYAFGEPLSNVAVVNAKRQREKLLIELANYSAASQEVKLVINPGNFAANFLLSPKEQKKLTVAAPENTSEQPLTITISAPLDALEFDNTLTLYPDEPLPVAVGIAAGVPKNLKDALVRVLSANSLVMLNQNKLDIEVIFTDGAAPVQPSGRSAVFFHASPEKEFSIDYNAPITLRQNHSLLSGVSAANLQWYAQKQLALPGQVLIRHGDTVLLSRVGKPDGTMDLHFNIDFRKGNFLQHPVFPILFWNIVKDVAGGRPGMTRHNYLRKEVIQLRRFTPAPEMLKVIDLQSNETVLEHSCKGYQVQFAMAAAGIYQVTCGEQKENFTVSPLAPAESDLSMAKSGTINRIIDISHNLEVRKALLVIYLLLAATAILAIEQLLTGQRRSEK